MSATRRDRDPDGPLQAGTLDEAVYWTVLYSDIFDFPLTRDEAFKYLMTLGAPRSEVDAAVDHALRPGGSLETDGEFLFLRGRGGTAARRRKRALTAATLWRQARFYARVIWALPFIRMVAVTGALAMDNVESGDDVDFLIVTEPGRLWMARGMIVLLCRLARLAGHNLCPNFLITSRVLHIDQQDLYAAHELAQMIPMRGSSVARRLWAENQWYRDFLPNAQWNALDGRDDALAAPLAALKSVAELLLRSRVCDAIEDWERERKIRKLSRQVPPEVRETLFTVDVCKGHQQGHGSRIMREFASRIDPVRSSVSLTG